MNWKTALPYILLAFFAVVLALNFFVRDPDMYPIVRLVPFVIAIGLGIGSTIYAAHAYGFSSQHGRALLTIACGMGLILTGDLSFTVMAVLNQPIPLPSIADLFYFLGYFLFVLGFFQETRLYKIDIKSIDPFTKIILGLFIATLAIVYLEVFSAYEPQISPLANLARVSYGIFDFLLLAVVLLVLKMSLGFGKGKLFLPWLVIFFGIVSSMTGNLIYSLTFEKYLMSVWPFTMVNIFWVGAYLLAGYGFLDIGNVLREAQTMMYAHNPQKNKKGVSYEK